LQSLNEHLVSPCGKYGFCPIPKNASSSFRYFFIENEWYYHFPNNCKHVFYIKRDPHSRFISGLKEVSKRCKLQYPDYPSYGELFEMAKRGRLFIDIHLIPHIYFLNQKINYTSILYDQNFLLDIKELLNDLNLNWNALQHYNKSDNVIDTKLVQYYQKSKFIFSERLFTLDNMKLQGSVNKYFIEHI